MVAGEMAQPALRRISGLAHQVMKQQEWITLVVRVVLAAILFYAGWVKFRQPQGLQKVAVSAYRILPDGMVAPVAFGQPLLEMALAIMLLVGLATRVMAICIGVLFVIFIAGVISVWVRGLSIDCGCFGGGGTVAKGQTHYLQEILRDTGFLVLAAWSAVFPRGRFALDRALKLYGR